MRLNCAAKHLCGMRPILMTNPQHYCVNCSDPLHGALCGFLITELPPYANIDVRCMTDSGRSKFEERNMDVSALICKYCLETLQDAHLKEPATSTTDSAASSNTETPAASTAASTNTESAASTNTGSVVPEAASTPVIVDLSSESLPNKRKYKSEENQKDSSENSLFIAQKRRSTTNSEESTAADQDSDSDDSFFDTFDESKCILSSYSNNATSKAVAPPCDKRANVSTTTTANWKESITAADQDSDSDDSDFFDTFHESKCILSTYSNNATSKAVASPDANVSTTPADQDSDSSDDSDFFDTFHESKCILSTQSTKAIAPPCDKRSNVSTPNSEQQSKHDNATSKHDNGNDRARANVSDAADSDEECNATTKHDNGNDGVGGACHEIRHSRVQNGVNSSTATTTGGLLTPPQRRYHKSNCIADCPCGLVSCNETVLYPNHKKG
eukprot:scaffold133488_cov39-Cyclotella_meneghiniana.AAC.10